MADNYWATVRQPAVQYGLRGICFFFVEVTGLAKDLHSGKFGGVVCEPVRRSCAAPRPPLLPPAAVAFDADRPSLTVHTRARRWPI